MENPNFHLEGIVRERNELQDFEGPLSLSLMLLSKNKIEIRDLKISDILDQYLAYLERMQSMDGLVRWRDTMSRASQPGSGCGAASPR